MVHTIKMQRALTPAEMFETECGLCDRQFRVASVWATLHAGDVEVGQLCPPCIEGLGRSNPERFPTRAEYEQAKRLYPNPIWASLEEAERAENEGTFEDAVTASWISRSEIATSDSTLQ